jgi:hypothetical protein
MVVSVHTWIIFFSSFHCPASPSTCSEITPVYFIVVNSERNSERALWNCREPLYQLAAMVPLFQDPKVIGLWYDCLLLHHTCSSIRIRSMGAKCNAKISATFSHWRGRFGRESSSYIWCSGLGTDHFGVRERAGTSIRGSCRVAEICKRLKLQQPWVRLLKMGC